MNRTIEYPYLDLHVAGEPFRLITEKYENIPGKTMEEKRIFAGKNLTGLRVKLLMEPRGHRDMYGGLLTPPVNPGSDFGVLFMNGEGWSTMCGHGVLALTRAALELGLVNVKEGRNAVVIDTPSATIQAFGDVEQGKVKRVGFQNDISFVCCDRKNIVLQREMTVQVSIAYGGAFMAFADAAELGVSLQNTPAAELIKTAVAVRDAVEGQASSRMVHPLDPEKNGKKNGFCMILTEGPELPENAVTAAGEGLTEAGQAREIRFRSFTVFGDGFYDRSPTGTGSCALAALMYERGLLKPGMRMVNRGITDIPFTVTVEPENWGIRPELTGQAWITGKGVLIFEEDDPLQGGFVLR